MWMQQQHPHVSSYHILSFRLACLSDTLHMTPFLIALLLAVVLHGDSPASRSFAADVTLNIPPDTRLLTSSGAAADTVKSGQTFITNLPDSLYGQSVVRYRGITLPARSWLLKRSFFWKTSASDRGDHEFWFRALLKDETTDSLSIRVTVK